jgi:hypothetical protein
MNSQFAQVVFLTGINSKNRFTGIDLFSTQNQNIMNDTNRILFCSGIFSFKKTNEFANSVGVKIKSAFENYKSQDISEVNQTVNSAADEILKFKNLLDCGVITQEEFDAKKKQLLNL